MRRLRDTTLGADPLAAVFPRSSREPLRQQEVSRSARRITVGVSLDPEVRERARNAVYWTPGLTLTDLATQALAAAVDDLETSAGSHSRRVAARRASDARSGRWAPTSRTPPYTRSDPRCRGAARWPDMGPRIAEVRVGAIVRTPLISRL